VNKEECGWFASVTRRIPKCHFNNGFPVGQRDVRHVILKDGRDVDFGEVSLGKHDEQASFPARAIPHNHQFLALADKVWRDGSSRCPYP